MNVDIIDKRLINMAKANIRYATVVITINQELKEPPEIRGFTLEYWMPLVPAMMGKLALDELDFVSYESNIVSIELPIHKATANPWEQTNY